MKTLITLLILTVGASAYTKAQSYELQNLRTTGRAAKEACNFYTLKMQAADKRVKEHERKIDSKEKDLAALYTKAKCRLKDKCDHSRKKPCYKYARSLKTLKADIKKAQGIMEKYLKEYNTNKKFAERKGAEYKKILAEYLKKREEWK